jgi:secondary thiamine-phosphate synthase enzyme
MKTVEIKTDHKMEFIDITEDVKREVERSGVREGLVNVYTRHTTASIVINEDEEGLLKDFLASLQRIVPDDIYNYLHNRIDNNASSHIRSLILSPEVSVPIKEGELWLGTWQSIFFLELDGPRRRSFAITVLGE